MIPDAAFEEIFEFFGQYTWHLDTRVSGNPDEINPEVLGYIFEQYINQAASGKKQHGAYYTPHDVTSYMVAQTLIPRIFSDIGDLSPFLDLLATYPERYIQPALLHGRDTESNSWLPVPDRLNALWEGDPLQWYELDEAAHDETLLLPGETWVEAFHRRERSDALLRRISGRKITQVNDLITENIAAQKLLTDGIDSLLTSEQLEELFHRITDLSVFDPTCGSGAFLFAALEVLEDIYRHIIDALALHADWSGKNSIVQLSREQERIEYFIRKHAAIHNLYGTDIMSDAIETAKLRVFLALAACADTVEDLKPLPDLDFNLKVGNLLVGFKDSDDVSRITEDLFTTTELSSLLPEIREYEKKYRDFVQATEADDENLTRIKTELANLGENLRNKADQIYATASGIPPLEIENWKQQALPFHWFTEFPEILGRGGFDVVIGNPPYIRMGKVEGYKVEGYVTSGCPDLYAACYERSLSLTHPNGRHAFIVMLNLAFGNKYEPVRQVLANRKGAEWWSTYGKWPTQLFNGIRVANTIVISGPGSSSFATRHLIFDAEVRQTLFQTMEYVPSDTENLAPPLRAGVATGLLRTIEALPSFHDASSSQELYIRPTGQYWFPVLWTNPPVLTITGDIKSAYDPGTRTLNLTTRENKDIAGATLAGKIGYAFWSAYGDDFHVNTSEATGARTLAAYVTSKPHDKLLLLAQKVTQAGMSHAFVSKNNDGYINVRWNAARKATDEFDRELLRIAGLENYWRDLNIWYRQVMRSRRPNHNSRLLNADEANEYLGWS